MPGKPLSQPSLLAVCRSMGPQETTPPPATFTHTDRLSDLRLIPKPFLFITPFMAYQDCVKMSFSLCKAGEELMEAIKKG